MSMGFILKTQGLFCGLYLGFCSLTPSFTHITTLENKH